MLWAREAKRRILQRPLSGQTLDEIRGDHSEVDELAPDQGTGFASDLDRRFGGRRVSNLLAKVFSVRIRPFIIAHGPISLTSL